MTDYFVKLGGESLTKGIKLKLTLLLVCVLAGWLIFGKSIQAKRLQQNFEKLIGSGQYKEALDVYNSAANDVVVNGLYEFENKTQAVVNNNFNMLVEKYMNESIPYESFKEKVDYILMFEHVDKVLVNKSMEAVYAIEKCRRALALSQRLLKEKQYEKALESLDSIEEADKEFYASAASLKADINKELKESVIAEMDKFLSLRKVSEAQKLLNDNKNMFDQQYIETKQLLIDRAAEELAVSDYDSKTNYLIIVDLKSQMTMVYEGKKGDWKQIKRYLSSSGIAGQETPTGDFTVTDRGDWFYTPRFAQGAKYWVRFYKTYLFHSLPMDSEKNIVDSTLGVPLSHGCVRLNVEEAKWIYENIPSGTRVIVK